MTLALLSALPALSSATPAPRFSASASLLPTAAASGGRFRLQAQLNAPGAPMPSDAKQPDPLRPQSVAIAAPRFKLLAGVRDVNAPAGGACALGTLFENGFE
jgi:hypothetical protein